RHGRPAGPSPGGRAGSLISAAPPSLRQQGLGSDPDSSWFSLFGGLTPIFLICPDRAPSLQALGHRSHTAALTTESSNDLSPLADRRRHPRLARQHRHGEERPDG